jgi:hypothetical protein
MTAATSVIFLTPRGGFLALGVVLPLAALVLVARRADRVRSALSVTPLRRRRLLVPTIATAAFAFLFGLAAAQPVAEQQTTLRVRTDAEVYIVMDVSRSMLARTGLNGTPRLVRAKVAANEIRSALPGVPVGVASLTDRVLPHLFPSTDEDAFRATVALSVGIERPPPRSSLLTTATSLDALAAMSSQRFFSDKAAKRVVVVLTDGETQGINSARLARFFHRPPGVSAVFVQFWGPHERVYTRDVPEPQYRPDPGARKALDDMAQATGAFIFGERQVSAATGKVKALLGKGPTVKQGERKQRHALAPFVVLAAALPLGVLLWRRDR